MIGTNLILMNDHIALKFFAGDFSGVISVSGPRMHFPYPSLLSMRYLCGEGATMGRSNVRFAQKGSGYTKRNLKNLKGEE